MKKQLNFNAYSVDEVKGVITYAVKSHGQVFVGVAKRSGTDKFDVETGKQIAFLRAEILQRKFDKRLTEEFIEWVKTGSADVFGPVSPHYMRAIQTATEEKKAQENHIRDLRNRLEAILSELK